MTINQSRPLKKAPLNTSEGRDLEIESIPVTSLKPYANNPRTHSPKQIRQIAESIKTFGWTNPILIDENSGVIAGHGRLEAANQLGISHVPTIRLKNMSEAHLRAYVIADNRLAENAGWDKEVLAVEFQALIDMDLDFDIELTGFEMGEIDMLIEGIEDATDEDEDDSLPPIESGPSVSRVGDLWALGDHRLLCGDATQAESYRDLLAGEKAQMVFTDPPYNVPIDGHVCGLGSVKHEEFIMASGEMSEAEFTNFLKVVSGHMTSVSSEGAIHFICMDWRHLFELLTAGRDTYTELKNLCVWNKSNGGMGSLYRSKHELVAVFKVGTGKHINNVALGSHGRYRTNVWDYAGGSSFSADRADDLAMHPTVKPVAMVEDAIRDCSKRGGVILDPFVGAGTTFLAAERAGRRGFGMELYPKYVDVTLKRYQKVTGEEPLHLETGRTFNELSLLRCAADKEGADV